MEFKLNGIHRRRCAFTATAMNLNFILVLFPIPFSHVQSVFASELAPLRATFAWSPTRRAGWRWKLTTAPKRNIFRINVTDRKKQFARARNERNAKAKSRSHAGTHTHTHTESAHKHNIHVVVPVIGHGVLNISKGIPFKRRAIFSSYGSCWARHCFWAKPRVGDDDDDDDSNDDMRLACYESTSIHLHSLFISSRFSNRYTISFSTTGRSAWHGPTTREHRLFEVVNCELWHWFAARDIPINSHRFHPFTLVAASRAHKSHFDFALSHSQSTCCCRVYVLLLFGRQPQESENKTSERNRMTKTPNQKKRQRMAQNNQTKNNT